MRRYWADLHIHTVLSPCAEYTMAPSLIVETALERGLSIIAITDHNSTENVAAVIEAARDTGLVVLPGMELETREEVHTLVLLPSAEQARSWQHLVYAHLPDVPNDEVAFGVQVVVTADDEIVRREERRLLGACDLSIDQVIDLAKAQGGFCIPAHIDRPSYGLLGSLGFIPPELDVPTVEISRFVSPRAAARLLPGVGDRALIQSSDAHRVEDIGTAMTCFELEEPTLAEVVLACRGSWGRRIIWDEPR